MCILYCLTFIIYISYLFINIVQIIIIYIDTFFCVLYRINCDGIILIYTQCGRYLYAYKLHLTIYFNIQ